MRIVCTSDFHGTLPPDVPPCDLLILAGDCLGSGYHTQSRGRNLYEWLDRQPAETIVGIAGNHDYLARDNPAAVRDLPWIYLEDSGCVVDGVKVWGSPWATLFFDWPYMLPEHQLAEKWALIPDDTNVLVVHGPAHGVLDITHGGEHVGSISLRDRIRELPDLQLLVSGHIHEAYGDTRIPFGENGSLRYLRCVNAALHNFSQQRMNPPIQLEILTTERKT